MQAFKRSLKSQQARRMLLSLKDEIFAGYYCEGSIKSATTTAQTTCAVRQITPTDTMSLFQQHAWLKHLSTAITQHRSQVAKYKFMLKKTSLNLSLSQLIPGLNPLLS